MIYGPVGASVISTCKISAKPSISEIARYLRSTQATRSQLLRCRPARPAVFMLGWGLPEIRQQKPKRAGGTVFWSVWIFLPKGTVNFIFAGITPPRQPTATTRSPSLTGRGAGRARRASLHRPNASGQKPRKDQRRLL